MKSFLNDWDADDVVGCLLFIGSVNNNKEDFGIVWTIFQYI